MSKILFSELIKLESCLNPQLNPFTDHFERNLTTTLDPVIAAKYQGEVEFDALAVQVIDAFQQLNTTYTELSKNIDRAISKLNYPQDKLIEYLFEFANSSCIEVTRTFNASGASLDQDQLYGLTETSPSPLRNRNNESIPLPDVMDSVTDSCIELLKIISIKPFTAEAHRDAANENERETLLLYMFENASYLYVYKAEFEKYQYEFAEIQFEPSSIKFKYKPENYHYLKFANREREHSGIYELQLYAKNLSIGPKSLSQITINEGGWIRFEEIRIPVADPPGDRASMIFLKYFYHLDQSISIETGLTGNILFYFCRSIEELFQRCFKLNVQSGNTVYKILKQDLLAYLCELNSIKIDQADKLLAQVSEAFSASMELWSKPLLAIDNFYYFFYPTTAFGSFTSKFEHLCNLNFPYEQQLLLFKDSIEKELTETNPNAVFKKLNDVDLIDFQDILIFETQKNIVVAKVTIIKYTLSHKESYDQLATLGKINLKFKEELNSLAHIFSDKEQFASKRINPFVITNHCQFSGLILDGIPILDIFLLKNYIQSGSYSKSITISNKAINRTEAVAEYKYYDDVEEFDENLAKYLHLPAPLEEILAELEITDERVSAPGVFPTIYSERIDRINLSQAVENSIESLQYNLRQLHYFEADYKSKDKRKTKKKLEDRIQFLMPIAFSFFALNKIEKNSRIRLLSIFSEFGILGIANLIFGLHSQIQSMLKKPIRKKRKWPTIQTDKAKAEADLKVAMASLSGKTTSISTAEIHHSFDETELNNLIAYLFATAAGITPKNYSDDELDSFYVMIMLISNLSVGVIRFQQDLYSLCENYIGLLNQNGKTQRARDLSEEFLAFSLKHEPYPLLGWLCMFKCFTGQKNVLDASFYGTLYFSGLNSTPAIDHHHAFDGLYNAFIFHRTFGYDDLSDSLFKSLSSFELSEYDLQKITLSYYNSFLKEKRVVNLFPKLDDFLKAHKTEIIALGHLGCYPWLAFFYNLRNIEAQGEIKIPSFVNQTITEFEAQIDPETLQRMKATYFAIESETEQILIQSLKKADETRNIVDYVAELSNLELIANNLIRVSIEPLNIQGLLLAGNVINDPTLTFEEKSSGGFTKLYEDSRLSAKDYTDYAKNTLTGLELAKGQVICWLFEYAGNVAALFVDHNKICKVEMLPGWEIASMKHWLSPPQNEFVFNELRGSINEQEQDYIRCLGELSFAKLNIPFEFTELLVCTSLELAPFPHNLLEMSMHIEAICLKNHEHLVAENVAQFEADFISFHRPVSNIVSLEWYGKYCARKNLLKSTISIEAWIPIDDQDMALYIAYTRLNAALMDYNCEIRTGLVPRPALSGTINFIAAHGEKGSEGFKAVHTKDGEDGHAILNGPGIEHIIGGGIIAVVFICNAGYATKEIYTQKLTFLVNQILKQGYQAVIAPAWKFNPEMCKIWTTEFLKQISEGNALSFAVHLANLRSAKEGFDNDNGFYAPSGWAIMHLHGNPNIRFV